MFEYETFVVARGARLLDEKWPGWWQEINLSTLDLRSVCNCVLGQLGVDYSRASVQILGSPVAAESVNPDNNTTGFDFFIDSIFPHLNLTQDDSLTYGFDQDQYASDDNEWQGEVEDDEGEPVMTAFAGLQRAWEELIYARQRQVPVVT